MTLVLCLCKPGFLANHMLSLLAHISLTSYICSKAHRHCNGVESKRWNREVECICISLECELPEDPSLSEHHIHNNRSDHMTHKSTKHNNSRHTIQNLHNVKLTLFRQCTKGVDSASRYVRSRTLLVGLATPEYSRTS